MRLMQMDPYKILGIEPRLVISREALNQAFREAGKKAHPDVGGNEESFAKLQTAVVLLQSPAKRLKVWLELKGIEVDTRGSIGNTLMDEFSRVGEVTQRAEAVIRKREAAQSALAKAMLENETQLCREALEVTVTRVEGFIEDICERFMALERAESVDPKVVEWHRDLSFLEKWQASLRALFGRLF